MTWLVANFHLRSLEPGEIRMDHVRVHGEPVRFERLRAQVHVEAPDVTRYSRLRRAGGSRRRGRLASQHWTSDCLRHWEGRWPASVSLADLRVAGRSQFVLSGGVPIAALETSWSPPLCLELCRRDQDVTLVFHNRDIRMVHVFATLLGSLP